MSLPQARPWVLNSIIVVKFVALVLQIVVVKEVMGDAPSKEEEDDFNYARTHGYRHIIGTRGATVDRSSGAFAILREKKITPRRWKM